SALLRGLIVVEIEQRCLAGETVRLEEYRSRFPALGPKWLAGAMQAVAAAQGGAPDPVMPIRRELQRQGPSKESAMSQASSARNPVEPSTGLELPDSGETGAPARLGRYRITAKLGAGGFGVVYKGKDEDLRRDVAIKVPHRHRISSSEDVEAYLTEARIVARLDHPGIVPVYDFGRTEDGLCYLVSKFVEGSDLRARLQQARPSCAESVQIIV